MFKKSQKGFTLIELLIVIAILGVLVAVIVPNVIGYTSRATIAAANAEADTVQTAVYAYMASNGGVAPTNTSDLTNEDLIKGTLKGVYSIGADGVITGDNATSGWMGIKWESGKWVKK